MLKITPIKNFIYTQKPISKIKKANIMPKIITGITLATIPFALYNCSKIDPPQEEVITTNNVSSNLSIILNTLGLIKDSNTLESINNIGFSDEEGNRNYIKFKTISEKTIDADFLVLNKNRNPVDSAKLTIEMQNKDIKLNIQKNDGTTEEQLYKIINREVVQYSLEDSIYVQKSKFNPNSTGFIQIFNNSNIKYFNKIQNNESIIIFDDNMNEIAHEITIN